MRPRLSAPQAPLGVQAGVFEHEGEFIDGRFGGFGGRGGILGRTQAERGEDFGHGRLQAAGGGGDLDGDGFFVKKPSQRTNRLSIEQQRDDAFLTGFGKFQLLFYPF